MQREEIAVPKQRLLVHLGIFFAAAPARDGMENDPASEGLRDLRHPPADIPHPYDTPGLPLQFIEGDVKIGKPVLGAVLARFDISVIMEQLLAQGKGHGEGMLGHHGRAVIPHIGHLDAPGTAIFQVAVVIPRGELADQLYPGRVFQRRLPQRRLVGNDDVRVLHPLPHLLHRHRVAICSHLPEGAQTLHRYIRPHAVPLQNHDFHIITSLSYISGPTAPLIRAGRPRLSFSLPCTSSIPRFPLREKNLEKKRGSHMYRPPLLSCLLSCPFSCLSSICHFLF